MIPVLPDIRSQLIIQTAVADVLAIKDANDPPLDVSEQTVLSAFEVLLDETCLMCDMRWQ